MIGKKSTAKSINLSLIHYKQNIKKLFDQLQQNQYVYQLLKNLIQTKIEEYYMFRNLLNLMNQKNYLRPQTLSQNSRRDFVLDCTNPSLSKMKIYDPLQDKHLQNALLRTFRLRKQKKNSQTLPTKYKVHIPKEAFNSFLLKKKNEIQRIKTENINTNRSHNIMKNYEELVEKTSR